MPVQYERITEMSTMAESTSDHFAGMTDHFALEEYKRICERK
jgi:dGTP triphosphohydrolase